MAKTEAKSSHWLVSTFGGFGYISCLLQWLWTGIVFVPLLLENQIIHDFLLPSKDTAEKPIVQQASEPNVFLMILAILITLTVVGISAVLLVRLPMSIAKVGKKTVTATAKVIVPTITHHHKLPPKKKRLITAKVVKYLKFTVSILPALLLGLVFTVETDLSKEIILFVGAILAAGSLFWFSLEYAFARLLKVSIDKVF